MPDLEAPPPSASMDHFRSEVNHRAELLVRHRRRGIQSGLAGVVALVVVALVVTVHAATPPARVSASGASRQSHGPGVTGTSGASDKAPSPHAPGATGAQGSSGKGLFRPSANSAAAPPRASAGSPLPPRATSASPPYVISDRPSGFVATTPANATVLIELRRRTGRWGLVVIGKNTGAVVTVVHQREKGSTVDVELRTHRPGTVTVTVPVVDHPEASWHGTIVVQ